MPTIVYREKGKGNQHKMFGFGITTEQADFIKAHKEINWRATIREYLASVISEVKQKESQNESNNTTDSKGQKGKKKDE